MRGLAGNWEFLDMFGWRKASRCKKLIIIALSRLTMLKQKRYSMVRQLREDLTELINNGYQQIAFNRVEQLIKDERLMEAYELIENFCEFILMNLSYIRKHKSFPDDINEAISSLIFASARCGDFPELKMVRKFFEQRYGWSELCPRNLVSPQMKEILSMKPVSDHEKQRLINELGSHCFHQAILALEYCPDWHQKQVIGVQTFCERIEPKLQNSNEKSERGVIGLDSSVISSEFSAPRCHSALSTVCCSKTRGCDQFDREDDDIVEVQNSTSNDEDLQDHRLFKFKSHDHHENRNKKSQLERCSKTLNGLAKRSRDVSTCSEDKSIRDIECASHRKEKSINCCSLSCHSCWFASVMDHCSLQHPSLIYSDSDIGNFECELSEQKIVNSHFIRSPTHLGSKVCGKDFHLHKDHILWTGDSNKQIVLDSAPSTQKTSCEIETMVYDVFIYSHHQPEENRRINRKPEKFSRNGKCEHSVDSNEMDRPSSHVHPKLPDYDEIAAKFMALKTEYLQNSSHDTYVI